MHLPQALARPEKAPIIVKQVRGDFFRHVALGFFQDAHVLSEAFFGIGLEQILGVLVHVEGRLTVGADEWKFGLNTI